MLNNRNKPIHWAGSNPTQGQTQGFDLKPYLFFHNYVKFITLGSLCKSEHQISAFHEMPSYFSRFMKCLIELVISENNLNL